MTNNTVELLSARNRAKLKEITQLTTDDIPVLKIVIRQKYRRFDSWRIQSQHTLRGFKNTLITLDSSVRHFKRTGDYPDKMQLGIGVFENGTLSEVLEAQ
jgi:hypothetical protein